jgi:sec-independent protein translocase protein TatA
MSPLLALLPQLNLIEILVIGAVILLLFGTRLPALMRSLGRGVVEFKKGVQGIDDESANTGEGLHPNTDREPTPVDAGRRV